MNLNLIEIEKDLENYSKLTNFTTEELSLFPENIRHIHSYKIFGDNLLAIPANVVIKEDYNEFEIPFSFVEDKETLNIFESEFRLEIPNEFIQIGYLNGSTEIVLLNIITNNIHIFHVSDIVDKDWLNYKLFKKIICNLEEFLENIRLQTVCCFINPKKSSEYNIFEIRNKNVIKFGEKILTFETKEQTIDKYKMLALNSLEMGFKIHFAPKKLLNELLK